MTKKVAIHWFRQDLRLSDNPALISAAKCNQVLPIYILDDKNAKENKIGSASRWWLHNSLISLKKSLGGNLSFYKGDPLEIFSSMITRFDIVAICWNRCYEPWRINRDKEIKSFLEEKRIDVQTHNGSLLWEPWTIQKEDNSPYKVFTPFYRRVCLQSIPPRKPLQAPKSTSYIHDKNCSIDIKALKLLSKVKWYKSLAKQWKVGEKAARNKFVKFIESGLPFYKDGRNIPFKPYVSRLSPYLHFGEISPNQLWHGVRDLEENQNIDHFCSELGWREFSYSQLYYNPDLPKKNLNSKFDSFPWINNKFLLESWQKGKTGIPIVDAGMRELWQTGYMHNRVRMIVGSFLVKNLLIHWYHGERWFWDTLVDADLANNSASWQWIAGCGADAAPYFRIFNPVTQGQKFDPGGDYTKKFVPELKNLANQYLFNPWEAPADVLEDAGVELGRNYPRPIVDLKESRITALEAFISLRSQV